MITNFIVTIPINTFKLTQRIGLKRYSCNKNVYNSC